MPDVPQTREIPDYPLAESLAVTTREQMKAITEPTRNSIIALLSERAASTTELAVALGKPKGTVDHHLKVLANANLVHVVRTRQVRAMTEKFWGRTARTFMFDTGAGDEPTPMWMLRDAHEEMSRVRDQLDDPDRADTFSTLRHARIPLARVQEFGERLYALTDEFVSAPRGGEVMYALVVALYPTDQPILPDVSGHEATP
ncbi:MAG: transcriptional regulator, TrmB [Ilumatobacteraceae bacterium]|nr:transcriptional regulator, TrmB [Ilumatobacteraceae bacterium]